MGFDRTDPTLQVTIYGHNIEHGCQGGHALDDIGHPLGLNRVQHPEYRGQQRNKINAVVRIASQSGRLI